MDEENCLGMRERHLVRLPRVMLYLGDEPGLVCRASFEPAVAAKRLFHAGSSQAWACLSAATAFDFVMDTSISWTIPSGGRRS
jgi:hypothetical protein